MRGRVVPKQEEGSPVTVVLTGDIVEELDVLAAQLDVPRGELAAELLWTAIRDAYKQEFGSDD
jgi:hypothetical protein